MIVKDIINGAFRLLGVIASGETASANEMKDALLSLNDILESWSLNGFMVNKTYRDVFLSVSSKSLYTIGLNPANDFNTAIPVSLYNAAIIQAGSNVELPLSIITENEYASIPDKTLTGMPTKIKYNYDSPTGGIVLYPIPNAGPSLVLYSEKTFVAFSSINDTVALPPAYAKALRYNLAVELAPEYNREPSQSLMMIAQKTQVDIFRVNDEPIFMETDAPTSGKSYFNILKGE